MSEYTPAVGDTVRRADVSGTLALEMIVTAVGEGSFLAKGASFGGEVKCEIRLGWVKVEPTPADRFMVFDDHGVAVVTMQSFHIEANARNLASGAYRVARFVFAEWIDR
jgi:hypothetical protein